MRLSTKILALGAAAMAGPLLALTAQQIAGAGSESEMANGDGAFVGTGPGFVTHSCWENPDGSGTCEVFGEGGGGTGGVSGGGGTGGGTGCPTGISPHVMLGWTTEGGGGGGTTPPPPPQIVASHLDQCWTDDGAAVQVATRVKGDLPPGPSGPSDPMRTPAGNIWMQVEFGAAIMRNSNGLYGATDNAIYSNDLTGYVAVSFALGLQVQGFWHNHPIRADPLMRAIDRYPSSNDWAYLQIIGGLPGASTDPSLWLTGSDGVTREFKLSERQIYETLTESQMENGVGLAGKERTQSCETPQA